MTTPTSGEPSRGTYAPTSMHFTELAAEAMQALEQLSDHGDARVHDGRVIAVKTTPLRGNSTQIVVGTAALPAGYSTPLHHHVAEEVAIIVSGSGGIEIDGEWFPVRAGSVLLTPANATHRTEADDSGPMVVLWCYAPPGSEARWMRD